MEKKKRPVILVTNDDGVTAAGLQCLIEVMKTLGKVIVVAPDKPQSGMGHAITVSGPLRLTKIKTDGTHDEYSCSGTPVDCVKLAINKIIKGKPDLVVSGINHGSNSSINIIYSGTMSAALEGGIENIPAAGFSLLDYSGDADFHVAKKYIKNIAENIITHGLPEGVCLNVNIPAVSKEKIKGVKICRQAKANWDDDYVEQFDPRHQPFYWLTGMFRNYDHGNDTDEWALKNNYISVVPVQFDFTAHHAISVIKKWKINE